MVDRKQRDERAAEGAPGADGEDARGEAADGEDRGAAADGGAGDEREVRAEARAWGDRLDAAGARSLERLGAILEQAAGAMSERAGEGAPTSAVAGRLRRAGEYVGAQTPKSALADLDSAIASHPYRSMAIGLGVGWLLGRLTRRLRAG